MKFSVLFNDLAAARRARRELREAQLLQWNDRTSLHDRRIQVDRLPIEHTSARWGAVVGAAVVGLVSAVVLSTIAVNFNVRFGLVSAISLGLAAGALFGGVFGAIAFATRPAGFIRAKKNQLRRGGALMVCDIEDARRAQHVRDRLEHRAHPQPA